MISSHGQSQPRRVVAEFGGKNSPSPVFLLERDRMAERDGSDDSELFVFRDADETDSPLATARLEHIDRDTREADLDLEINTHPAEFAPRLTVNDIRRGLDAIMKDVELETVHMAGNVSEESLLKMGCQAIGGTVEFSLTKEKAEPREAIAA